MITDEFKDKFEEFATNSFTTELVFDAGPAMDYQDWLNALTEIDKIAEKEINRLKNCMDDMDQEWGQAEVKWNKYKKELVEALEKVIHSATDENLTTEEYFETLRGYESLIAKHKRSTMKLPIDIEIFHEDDLRIGISLSSKFLNTDVYGKTFREAWDNLTIIINQNIIKG